MRKVNVFLVLLIVSLASLIVLVGVGFAVFASGSQYSSNWWGEMWGSMGGGLGGMMGGFISPWYHLQIRGDTARCCPVGGAAGSKSPGIRDLQRFWSPAGTAGGQEP